MTWEEFYEKVIEKFCVSRLDWRGRNVESWMGTPDCYEVEWRSGGISGGNCWGDQPSYSLDSDEIPEFTGIDELLEEICPDLSFMKYRKIMTDLVETDSRYENEYYGNYTTYGIRRINYRRLYDRLVAEKIL